MSSNNLSTREDVIRVDLDRQKLVRGSGLKLLGVGDQNGDEIGIYAFKDGEPFDFESAGYDCQGYFIRQNGTTVVCTGHISGNKASVWLPQACYVIEGQFALAIKVVHGTNDVIETVRIVDGVVTKTSTDTYIDPGTVVPDLAQLLAKIGACEDATEAANNAATNATNATSYIAGTYSTSSTYAIGDYVIYDGNLYRCITAISSGEAWTSGHWTQVKTMGEATWLESAVSNITNWDIDRMLETNLFVNNGVLYNNGMGRSVYFPVENGKTYRIVLRGKFNRFILAGVNSISSGATATVIETKPNQAYTEFEFYYKSNGTYNYILLTLAYNYNTTYVLSYNFVESTSTTLEKNVTIAGNETSNIFVTNKEKEYIITPESYSTKSIDDSNKIVGGNANLFAIPMNEAGDYYIKATGTFNRLGVFVGNSLDTNAQLTRITFESGNYTEKEITYSSNGTYAYLVLLLNYPYSSTAVTVNAKYNNLTNKDILPVNGVPVFTKDSVKTISQYVTGGLISENVPGDFFSGIMPDGEKIVSGTNNFNVYKLTKNGYYTIRSKGAFNRFGVYVFDSIEVNSPVTELTFKNGSFTDEEYTYHSTGEYAYIGVLSNYPYSQNASVVTCEYCETEIPDIMKISGTEAYTKKGIDDRLKSIIDNLDISLTNYISKNTVNVVTTVSAVYDLYDALVEQYPDYVSKEILGQDDFGNNLIQYTFTYGNYNAYASGQRDKDQTISKPVIMIISGIHGYERTSVMATYQFFLDMCENNNSLLDLKGNFTYKVIPLGDPSSFTNDTRQNGNGVNIDDNFDINWSKRGEGTPNFSGDSAADQPETQIIQDWIEDNTGAYLYIDFHNSGYVSEVSYLGGNNAVQGMEELKRKYLEGMWKFVPYLIGTYDFDDDLIFAYTGQFNNWSSSYNYASSKGLIGACLEVSWNQNGTGLHSSESIKVGAEVLGNMLRYYTDKI